MHRVRGATLQIARLRPNCTAPLRWVAPCQDVDDDRDDLINENLPKDVRVREPGASRLG